MNLLFDLVATQPNGTGKRHGGGKYGEVIFLRMLERNIKFSCFYNSRIWLNPEIKDACIKSNIVLYDIKESELREIVFNNKIDLIYSALPEHLANFNECPIIGTIHGLRLIERPFDLYSAWHKANNPFSLLKEIKGEFNGAYRNKVKKKLIKLMTKPNFKYVTVSNHSKYSILSQFPHLNPDSIKVFYSPSTTNQCEIINSSITEKYFLLVSTNRWDKNNIRAIEALDRMFTNKQLEGYKVILTGYKIRNNKIKKLLFGTCELGKYRIKNKDKFIFKGYVSENELSNLYANAYALIYPSLNEGFGYPPLEAMRYGTPVLASAIASIPEICDNSVLYFTPFSVEEIMNRILQITDSEVYSEYKIRAIKRYDEIKTKQDVDLDKLIDYIIME